MNRAALSLATLGLCCATIGCPHETPAPTPPASRPASEPAPSTTSTPATRPAAPPLALTTLLDVVRANDAAFPTTQPLEENLELTAAARLRVNEPVYLCSRGDLWITRTDAPPTPDVLGLARKSQTHVTREGVKFIYWRPVGSTWAAEVVTGSPDSILPAADVWVTATARVELDRSIARDWSRAGSWNTDAVQAAVVPGATGVSVIRVADGRVDEQFVKLADDVVPGLRTYYALDPRGLLAWSVNPAGPSSVARFIDGKWTMLTPDPAWPTHLVHVVPFLDGTVLAIGQDGDSIQLKSIALEPIAVDEARVLDLVKQLAVRDPETRQQAQNDLAQIGPGAWPVLRRLAPTLPAEARIRIRAILGNETTPTLSGIAPEPGAGSVVARLPDGGVILHFAAGASAVAANGLAQQFTPAWLVVRPGEPARRVPEFLTHDRRPVDAALVSWGDEWLIEHDVDGPLRWMGNHTEPLLTKAEAGDFKKFRGIDGVGRWLFTTRDAGGPTLIIDPTLPDPKPRLPVWTIDLGRGVVGWNDEGWPIIKRGQGAWILKDGTWSTLSAEAADATLRTGVADATTQPATQPTPLLTDAAGNVYGDGLQTLTVTRTDRSRLQWPLPAEATGTGAIGDAAVLIEAEGKLFLANAPGRLLRITPQLDQDPPFKLDAVFTRHLPTSDVRRIWKDPVGRIVYASGGSRLSIGFPSGRISNRMSNIIPAGALRDALQSENDR